MKQLQKLCGIHQPYHNYHTHTYARAHTHTITTITTTCLHTAVHSSTTTTAIITCVYTYTPGQCPKYFRGKKQANDCTNYDISKLVYPE